MDLFPYFEVLSVHWTASRLLAAAGELLTCYLSCAELPELKLLSPEWVAMILIVPAVAKLPELVTVIAFPRKLMFS